MKIRLFCWLLFLALQAPGQEITNIVHVYPPGWSMVANPLLSTNNDVSNIFKDPPVSLTINKRTPHGGMSYDYATYDPDIPGWTAPMSLLPGDGGFLFNPGPGNYTNVFVGQIVLCSTNKILDGFSIRSQILPSSTLTNYSPAPFETLFFFKQGAYVTYTFDPDAGGWTPNEPNPVAGESFWIYNPGPARDWVICVSNP